MWYLKVCDQGCDRIFIRKEQHGEQQMLGLKLVIRRGSENGCRPREGGTKIYTAYVW